MLWKGANAFQKCFIDFGLWKQIQEKPQKMIIQSSFIQQQYVNLRFILTGHKSEIVRDFFRSLRVRSSFEKISW